MRLLIVFMAMILFAGCGDDAYENCDPGEIKYEATGPDDGIYSQCYGGFWIPLLEPEVPVIGKL